MQCYLTQTNFRIEQFVYTSMWGVISSFTGLISMWKTLANILDLMKFLSKSSSHCPINWMLEKVVQVHETSSGSMKQTLDSNRKFWFETIYSSSPQNWPQTHAKIKEFSFLSFWRVSTRLDEHIQIQFMEMILVLAKEILTLIFIIQVRFGVIIVNWNSCVAWTLKLTTNYVVKRVIGMLYACTRTHPLRWERWIGTIFNCFFFFSLFLSIKWKWSSFFA